MIFTGEMYPLLAVFAADSHTKLLLTLFVMFVTAKLFAEIFERVKQPAVAAEILAGIIIGPSVLGWVQPSELTSTLAEIGVLFLLFRVGLETRPSDIFRVGLRATLVAVLGVIVPFIAGYTLFRLWGRPQIEAIFVGAALVATSVGITARVLGQMNVLGLETSRIILGAAVIDDVLGLLILAVVSSMAKGGVDYAEIGTTAALAIGFTLLVALVGARTVNKIRHRVEKLRVGQAYLVFGLAVCLGLGLVASYIGVAAIVGAFLAGMALSESTEGTDMPMQAEAVTEFLLPFFLVNIGMQLRLDAFLTREGIVLALLVTFLAAITKVIGCGLAAAPLGFKRAMQVGVGMIPRGEVGIVVAQLGLGMHTISDLAYGVVLFMAVMSTLIAPPFLVPLFKGEQQTEDDMLPISSLS
ncbi:MAG TPA: cation:proton antiporter [Blastocatellia bacterium]|nr:cation:proton antiporter [Blastocatellia bacterium]